MRSLSEKLCVIKKCVNEGNLAILIMLGRRKSSSIFSKEIYAIFDIIIIHNEFLHCHSHVSLAFSNG